MTSCYLTHYEVCAENLETMAQKLNPNSRDETMAVRDGRVLGRHIFRNTLV